MKRLRFASVATRRAARAYGCVYCGRRIWPLARLGRAYDNHGVAHLRCCSIGRMPL